MEIVSLALTRGHQVTAFVRSPRKLTARHGLRVLQGDPLNTQALQAAMPGHDAVLSAIGPATREALRPSTLLTDGAASTVAAMTAAGVSRLAIVSAAILFAEKGLQFAFFRYLLRHHGRDLTTMEAVVTASDLAWTIARPPRLIRKSDDAYRTMRNALPHRSRPTPFRAVAAFMLDAIERREHVAEIVGVSR
jgi:putative NADH-flavin reductase